MRVSVYEGRGEYGWSARAVQLVMAVAGSDDEGGGSSSFGSAMLTASDESLSYSSYPRFRCINLLKKSKCTSLVSRWVLAKWQRITYDSGGGAAYDQC